MVQRADRVIGRAQNPRKSAIQPYGTRRYALGSPQQRRRAVVNNLGNTWFICMAGKPEYDKSLSTAMMLDGLRRLGIKARPCNATIW